MPSNFPGAIDSFTDPLSNSPLNSPSQSALHTDINDAVEKVEQYMGLVKVIPTGATNGTVGATGTVTIGNAVSSVTVSGAFSSLYDNYRIKLVGGSHSSSTALRLQIGGATTGYYQSGAAVQIGVGTFIGLSASNTNAYFANAGRSGANGAFLDVEIFSPFLAARTGVSQNSGDFLTTGFWIIQGGFVNDATSYTSFTLTADAGTFTGGTIRVYGYRN